MKKLSKNQTHKITRQDEADILSVITSTPHDTSRIVHVAPNTISVRLHKKMKQYSLVGLRGADDLTVTADYITGNGHSEPNPMVATTRPETVHASRDSVAMLTRDADKMDVIAGVIQQGGEAGDAVPCVFSGLTPCRWRYAGEPYWLAPRYIPDGDGRLLSASYDLGYTYPVAPAIRMFSYPRDDSLIWCIIPHGWSWYQRIYADV